MATQSSILVWRISWTEEPGGLQSIGSQRVKHDQSNLARKNKLYELLFFTVFYLNWNSLRNKDKSQICLEIVCAFLSPGSLWPPQIQSQKIMNHT